MTSVLNLKQHSVRFFLLL